jgi:hypothetical protein
MAVIRCALALPSLAEGLARVTACDERDASVGGSVELADVSVDGYTTEAL